MLKNWYAKHVNSVMNFLNRFYSPKKSARDQFADLVNAHLLPHHRVLHIGCADYTSLYLKGRCQEVIGVDISQSVLTNSDVDKAIVADIETVELPAAYFDLVLCKGLIEHLKNPMVCFQNLSQATKQGAFIIVLTPNVTHYGALATKLTPHGFHRWYVEKVLKANPEGAFPAYYRANRPGKLSAMMAKAGFETHCLKMIDTPPYYLAFSYPSAFIGIGYERLVSHFDLLADLRFWILGVFCKRGRLNG
jgi:2-polyprenyl-3-methyl-5-hydroxy-6-metoxy-1,4-benzoquinol methylase